MKKYIYGFDIGGTTIKIGLFNLTGDLLKKWEISTDVSNKGGNILFDIYHSIKAEDILLEEVLGYGFGVPGPIIDGEIERCVNLGWKNYDLKSKFFKLTNNDNIYIGNDANIATLGESLHGVAKGYQKIAMITVGTGIGGGFVVDSKIIDGAHGAAGEIGHIKVVHENQIQCNCGNYGCLETVASATGIKREFKRLVETTKLPSILRGKTYVSVKMIFDAAKKDDLLCRTVVDKTAYYIGYTCHIISLTTNPEIIIIGGGVSNAGRFFIDLIQKYFNQFLFLPVRNTIITKATLGNDAGIYGAASLVKND